MSECKRSGLIRAVALIAATYVYFLIFAEFAFLELARPVVGDGDRLRLVMGALGAGGAAGSVLAARLFKKEARGGRLSSWLLLCAFAAFAALLSPSLGVFGLAAAGAAVGLALGGSTVTLASGLSALVSRSRLGLAAGLGTGAAYAICNLPWVFAAMPATQTWVAICAALLGSALASGLPSVSLSNPVHARNGLGWMAVFLALVWMDSAAFYIIQHTDSLKSATWGDAWTLGGNAAAHFLAAVLAGLALDRGWAGSVAAVAAGLLALACLWIEHPRAELAYVAGVSLYSAALVYVPAREERPGFAAALFAVAGWGGSALGIGMAQDLHGVPAWFAFAAPIVVVGGLWWCRRTGGLVILVLATLGFLFATDARAAEPYAEAAARGREVYVSEGCIHCHSQYVRPGTADIMRWGPERPLDELLRELPPLLGNRRQGPDLLNVGNRRTPEWNRLHLVAPRAVSPGSRMPSYARLFAPGERRGEDLLAYLDSLGEHTREARAEQIAAWRPAPDARIDVRAGATWFVRACVQCHGPEGRGDGPLALRLSPRPADLTRPRPWDDVELARLVKFGRPGTAMAGHEALDDDAVVSLARHVRRLQDSSPIR